MNRNEFVSTLRSALTGEVPDFVVEDNVRYYSEYISREVAGGKSEQEVLEMLGSPRLIARTIIDTQGQQGAGGSSYGYSYAQEERNPERERGFHMDYNEDGGVDLKYRRFNLNTWYGRLIIMIVMILALTLIFTVVGGILSWILPVLFPVLLIVWVIRFFFRDR